MAAVGFATCSATASAYFVGLPALFTALLVGHWIPVWLIAAGTILAVPLWLAAAWYWHPPHSRASTRAATSRSGPISEIAAQAWVWGAWDRLSREGDYLNCVN